jgi:ribosomal protein S18 acetylase RimI-like enzyme
MIRETKFQIEYRTSSEGIQPEMLEGFFVGWTSPRTPQDHVQILKNSQHIVLALDLETGKVVGFITAITDLIQAAFIPLLEVVPTHQGQGIGSELMSRMLEQLQHFPCIDLMCAEELQPFYDRFGMRRSRGMLIRNY